MVGRFVLADSNVLVHLTNRASHVHTQARHAVQTLERNGANLLYTSQNLAEFWNVCTRPAPSGLDLTVDEAWRRVIAIEAGFGYLPEAASAENKFKALLITYRVRGVQVHDARLAAVCWRMESARY